MSGHSKWAGIKHKKAVVDSRRGKLFAKLIRAVEVAARQGGGNPDSNPTLADAISRARDASMPGDTIDRAIKRGTGDLEGVKYEALTYEGYGPGGAAVVVEVLTDNRNRAAAEVRRIFTKAGGSLADPGAVSWMFNRKGMITIPGDAISEESLLGIALDAGVEDVGEEDGTWRVTCASSDLHSVRTALEKAGLRIESARLSMEPSATVPLVGPEARAVLRLLDELEESDDVQEVYSNFDVPDEVLADMAGS